LALVLSALATHNNGWSEFTSLLQTRHLDNPWFFGVYTVVLLTSPVALLAVAVAFWVRSGKTGDGSLRGRGNSGGFADYGKFAEAIGNEGTKLVGFVKGLLWFALGTVLVIVGWRFINIAPSMAIWRIIGWCAFGGGILAGLKSLSELGPVFRMPPRLQNHAVHGDARKATEAEANAAARGSTGKPPWADHKYAE
jgi:hypothetical protein